MTRVLMRAGLLGLLIAGIPCATDPIVEADWIRLARAVADDAQAAPFAFKPPDRGAPKRRVSAATRGDAASADLALTVLAPEDIGLTASVSPVLYWWQSRAADLPVRLIIVSADAIDPVYDAVIAPRAPGGINAVDLGALGVSLRPGISYDWSVTLEADPAQPSRNPFSLGVIEVVEAAAVSPGGDPAGRASEAAQTGRWYDLLHVVHTQATERSGSPWTAARTALLTDAGLTQVTP